MIGLMQKYGSFEYEDKKYLMKGLDHWQSDGISEFKKNDSLLKAVRWG